MESAMLIIVSFDFIISDCVVLWFIDKSMSSEKRPDKQKITPFKKGVEIDYT